MWLIDKILGRTPSAKRPDKDAYATDIPEHGREALLHEAEARSFDMADQLKTPPAH
jgi:hypothetical protein